MTDDHLAAVLREIAKMENAPGFEGPKITHYLLLTAPRKRKEYLPGDHSRYIWEDHVVGEIRRAVKARSGNGLDDRPVWTWEANGNCEYPWFMVKIYRVDRDPAVFGYFAPTLALAAAMAYRDALKASYP